MRVWLSIRSIVVSGSTAWWPADAMGSEDSLGSFLPLTLLYNPMILSLRVLDTLLAFSLIGLGAWFTSQSYQPLSSSSTCGRLLLISSCSNISISCAVDFLCLSSSCLSSSGCLGLSGLNLTSDKSGGLQLAPAGLGAGVGFAGVVAGVGLMGLGAGVGLKDLDSLSILMSSSFLFPE